MSGVPNSVRELHTVVEQKLQQERTERRHGFRRQSDQIAALQVEQARHARIIFGEHGANGLAGDVRQLRGADRRWERVAWLTLAIVLSTVVGVGAYFAR